MMPDPCTPRDIQLRLNITADWWAHNWRRVLVERYGFPQPLPGFMRPFKWNPAHVEAWIARQHDWLTPAPAASAEQAYAHGADALDNRFLDITLAERAAHLATNRRRRAAEAR
jgi:hypothetical protein